MNCKWVAIGNGRLTLWHFLGKHSVARLKDFGVTRVITLLTEAEGALRIRDAVAPLEIAWTWLPVKNGNPPVGDTAEMLRRAMPVLVHLLDAGESILIHCSAGIHRTGMVAFALLRWRGYSESDALDAIAQMRALTREGLRAKQLRFGNTLAALRAATDPA